MKLIERTLWIGAVAVITGGWLGYITSKDVQAKGGTFSVQRLQIVDRMGHTRITLATDSEGTAKITFLSPDRKTNSVIEQFRDGNIRLQFAGIGQQEPSVVLMTDLRQGGPALMMRGRGERKTILLGFQKEDAAKPFEESKVWGLFIPGTHPFENLAAIGGAESLNSKQRRGFVYPAR